MRSSYGTNVGLEAGHLGALGRVELGGQDLAGILEDRLDRH